MMSVGRTPFARRNLGSTSASICPVALHYKDKAGRAGPGRVFDKEGRAGSGVCATACSTTQ